ncbi:tail fiber protein [Vreelandella maris]|uniref:Tail fiber protein n=1 Tax=Vreelandella maris TaxID=2729617 RepID=A0A7Y6RFJ7_9GAMM|nr:tail fiber protein [Halomonas maris]NVF16008.1 tail fiber protein [Halomonas maris]
MVDRVYERNASDSAPQPPADPSSGYPTAGNPAQGVPATQPGPYWYHMITESLRRVVVEAGLTPDHEDLDQLLGAIKSSGQFADYSESRTYETGETCRGSDGVLYEFYDRDQDGTVQGVDPTDNANRPHIWMRWDGVKPGTTIAWRSEDLPEGYLPNDGWQSAPRQDYRRIFAAFGTTWGEGDGATTFGMPGDENEFLRGWDPNGSRGLAEHQADMLKAHAHPQSVQRSKGGTSSSMPTVNGGNNGLPFNVNGSSAAYDIISGESTSAVGGSENRPSNNAARWLTKI